MRAIHLLHHIQATVCLAIEAIVYSFYCSGPPPCPPRRRSISCANFTSSLRSSLPSWSVSKLMARSINRSVLGGPPWPSRSSRLPGPPPLSRDSRGARPSTGGFRGGPARGPSDPSAFLWPRRGGPPSSPRSPPSCPPRGPLPPRIIGGMEGLGGWNSSSLNAPSPSASSDRIADDAFLISSASST